MSEMDWNARLTRAEKRGKFTRTDRDLGRPWTSCAVGEHSGCYDVGKFMTEGEPNANGLFHLGIDFSVALRHDDIAEARRIYDRIQAWFRRYGKRAA